MTGPLLPAEQRGLAIVLIALLTGCVPSPVGEVFPRDALKAPVVQKAYKLDESQIRDLVRDQGACYASDMITVEGRPVGYMYRVAPEHEFDSGWLLTFDFADDSHR